MNQRTSARNYFFSQADNTMRAFLPSVIASFVLHIIVFGALFYTPGSFFKKKITPSAINVNLVSLPDYFPEPEIPKTKKSMKQETKEPEIKPESKPEPKPEPKHEIPKVQDKPVLKKAEPSPAPVKEKLSLKRQTYKTGKVKKNAIKEIEKRVEDTRLDSVAKALEQIQKNLDKTKPEDLPVENAIPGTEDMQPKPGSNAPSDKMEIYQLQVREIFNKNWAFSEQIAGEYENLKSIVVCTILPNGNIGDVWFEKRSGNKHLDDSAYKAILKSGPLPPLPHGYTQPYTAGYVFTPSGVQD